MKGQFLHITCHSSLFKAAGGWSLDRLEVGGPALEALHLEVLQLMVLHILLATASYTASWGQKKGNYYVSRKRKNW